MIIHGTTMAGIQRPMSLQYFSNSPGNKITCKNPFRPANTVTMASNIGTLIKSSSISTGMRMSTTLEFISDSIWSTVEVLCQLTWTIFPSIFQVCNFIIQ